MSTCLITATIPYVNARPHIGFALELVQADTLARWHRQKGDDVKFLTGTDENAIKNVLVAKEQGLNFTQADLGGEVVWVPSKDVLVHVESFFPLTVSGGDLCEDDPRTNIISGSGEGGGQEGACSAYAVV